MEVPYTLMHDEDWIMELEVPYILVTTWIAVLSPRLYSEQWIFGFLPNTMEVPCILISKYCARLSLLPYDQLR